MRSEKQIWTKINQKSLRSGVQSIRQDCKLGTKNDPCITIKRRVFECWRTSTSCYLLIFLTKTFKIQIPHTLNYQIIWGGGETLIHNSLSYERNQLYYSKFNFCEKSIFIFLNSYLGY